MSGDYQHFIPQHFLKGFAFRSADRARNVWVFQKGAPAESKPIKEFGGGEHFYSEPGKAVEETLDDAITKYENRLAAFIRNLRKQVPGPVPDSEVAAEIVAHLTMRTESVRSGLTFASKLFIAKAIKVFGDEQKLRSIFGLDYDQPSSTLQEHLKKMIEENPVLAQSGIPPQALERVLFGFLKENFSTFFKENKHIGQGALASAYLSADQLVRDSHNNGLGKSLVPEARTKMLKQLHWSILSVDGGLVLPDCIAISLNSKEGAKPYLFGDVDDVAIVAMPLSFNRLLLGKVNQDEPFNLSLFNLRAVACSENFFISRDRAKEFEEWTKYIGVEPRTLMFSTVDGVFSEYLGKKVNVEKVALAGTHQENEKVSTPWQISFIGCADEPTAQKIGDVVSAVVIGLAKIIPLNRIDGITFAEDYPAALRDLDRGVPTLAPLETTSEEGVVGIGMSPIVLREGVVKTRIVLRAFIGHALIGEDENDKAQAYQILVGQLVEASCTEMLDNALPGILLKPIENAFDRLRFAGLEFAWSNYISARISAKLDENCGGYLRDFLIAALDKAQREVPEVRFEYRFHGKIPQLMDDTFLRVKPILQHAARALGHFDGIETSLFDDAGVLQGALERYGLCAWLRTYHRDLQGLWDRLGQWESFDEFLALAGHVERLLWQFGIVLWQMDDGGCRVEVPLATDIQRLAAHEAARLPPNS